MVYISIHGISLYTWYIALYMVYISIHGISLYTWYIALYLEYTLYMVYITVHGIYPLHGIYSIIGIYLYTWYIPFIWYILYNWSKNILRVKLRPNPYPNSNVSLEKERTSGIYFRSYSNLTLKKDIAKNFTLFFRYNVHLTFSLLFFVFATLNARVTSSWN
jgi:hypothetical protein